MMVFIPDVDGPILDKQENERNSVLIVGQPIN
jgi:hypothetical protein